MPQRAQNEKVRVVCRCRPENQKELEAGGTSCVRFFSNDRGVIEVNVDDVLSTFSLDRMFSPESTTQQAVFEDTAAPLVADVLQGYNATIFAYGQTGTGKTHTMMGSDTDPGIIPRVAEALFEGVAEADENVDFTIAVSYVEIYMEKIRCLLDPQQLKNNLAVREDKGGKGLYIEGVTQEYVTSQEELLDVMDNGAINRTSSSTGMNDNSSRSHSVFTIIVTQKDTSNGSSKAGKLVLVDLAGSEMVRKSKVQGQQLEEAKTINKSLAALGNVINALSEGAPHIPYRDSKLTRILQDSLGGNSKTVLIVAISPSSYNGSETISTLRFGTRAKSIENKVVVNATRSVDELEALLARAEKAMDLQSMQISALQSERQALYQKLVDRGIDCVELGFFLDVMPSVTAAGTGVSGVGDFATPMLASGGAVSSGSGSGDTSAAVLQLTEQIQQLTFELEEEREDTSRKDSELAHVTKLLRDKERLLSEAGELLLEARRHYESQRERCELLTREKSESVGALEMQLTASKDECASIRFELKEMEVSMETLLSENRQLKQEVAEMSGDVVNERAAPRSRGTGDDVGAIGPGSNGDRVSMSSPGPSSSASATIAAVPLSALGGTLSNAAERTEARSKSLAAFAALVARLQVSPPASEELSSWLSNFVLSQESLVGSFETRFQALEQASVEQGRRIKDLETQRSRLEGDLSSRNEKVVSLQLQLDALSSMEGAQAAEVFASRERAHMKSLQLRLEQLVAVHRQLLRKFASLELDSNDMRKKITLRDERIKQLEGNSRGLTTSMRAQAERHVAELSNLREQIQVMRSEHVQRVEMARLALENASGSTPKAAGGPRTLRGGASRQTTVTPGSAGSSGVPERTVRGGGRGLHSMEEEEESPRGGSGGIFSAGATASSIFSKLLGSK